MSLTSAEVILTSWLHYKWFVRGPRGDAGADGCRNWSFKEMMMWFGNIIAPCLLVFRGPQRKTVLSLPPTLSPHDKKNPTANKPNQTNKEPHQNKNKKTKQKILSTEEHTMTKLQEMVTVGGKSIETRKREMTKSTPVTREALRS